MSLFVCVCVVTKQAVLDWILSHLPACFGLDFRVYFYTVSLSYYSTIILMQLYVITYVPTFLLFVDILRFNHAFKPFEYFMICNLLLEELTCLPITTSLLALQ
jgi:hypothetical protein